MTKISDLWSGEEENNKQNKSIDIKFDKPYIEEKYKKFYQLLDKENEYLKNLSEKMYESIFEGKEFTPPPIPKELESIKDELKLKRDELMRKIKEKAEEDKRVKKEMTEKVFDDFFEKELKLKPKLSHLCELWKKGEYNKISDVFSIIKTSQTLDELRKIVEQQKPQVQKLMKDVQNNQQPQQQTQKQQSPQQDNKQTKTDTVFDSLNKYLMLFKKYAPNFKSDTGINVMPTKQEEEQVLKTRSLNPIKEKINKVKEYQLKLNPNPKEDTSFPIDGLWGVKSQQRWKVYQKQRAEEKTQQDKQLKETTLPDVETGLDKNKVKTILTHAVELSKTTDYISPNILDDLLYKLSFIQTHIESDQLKYDDKEKDVLIRTIKNLRKLIKEKSDAFKKM